MDKVNCEIGQVVLFGILNIAATVWMNLIEENATDADSAKLEQILSTKSSLNISNTINHLTS